MGAFSDELKSAGLLPGAGTPETASPQQPAAGGFTQELMSAGLMPSAPTAQAPEPAEPELADYAKVGIRALASVPREVAAGAISAFQGMSGVEAPGQEDVFEKFVRQTERQGAEQQRQVAQQFPEATGIQALSRLGQQVGFSAPSMAAGIGAGVLAAPSAAVTAGAGPFVAGGATAGGVAYRASSAQVMRSYIDALDEEKRASTGQGLTPEETEAAKADFESKATEVGLWEALPEAVGGAVAGRLIFGPIKKMVGEKLARTMMGKIGVAAGTVGEELVTEAVTQVGQEQALRDTILGGGEALEWTPGGMLTALQQVAPDVLLTTAVLGGAAKGGQMLYQRRQESEFAKRLGIDRGTLSKRIQDVLAYKAQNPDAQITTDEINRYLAGAVTLGEPAVAPPAEVTPPAVAPPAEVTPPAEAVAPPAEAVAPPAEASAQERTFEALRQEREARDIREREVAALEQFRRGAQARQPVELTEQAPLELPAPANISLPSGEVLPAAQFYQMLNDRLSEQAGGMTKEEVIRSRRRLKAEEEAFFEVQAIKAKPEDQRTRAEKAKLTKHAKWLEPEVAAAEVLESPTPTLKGVVDEVSAVREEGVPSEAQVSAVRAEPARGEEVAPQIPLTVEGVPSAPVEEEVGEGVPAERERAADIIPEVREDRVVAPPEREAGAEAGAGDILRDTARAEKVTTVSALPRLKRGYKREVFTVDAPSYAGNVFVEDTSTKGKKTLHVRGRDGSVRPASKFVAEQIEKKERVAYEGPAFAEDVSAMEVLTATIEDEVGRALPAGTFTEVDAPAGQEAVFAELSKVLDRAIVFFKATNAPMRLNGMTGAPGAIDTIFVNIDSTAPHLVVTGHEFLHNLKREDIENYYALQQAVIATIPESARQAKWKRLSDKRIREGRLAIDMSKIDEELVADFFGEQFMSKAFWRKVERKNPEGFAGIVQSLIDFLGKIKSAFTGQQRKDIERAQDIAADVLARYVKRSPEATVERKFAEDPLPQLGRTAKANIGGVIEALRSGSFVTERLPEMLLVTPEKVVGDIFSDRMPLLPKLYATRKRKDAVRNEIVDYAALLYQELTERGKKGPGVKAVENTAALASFNQMWPDKDMIKQDWVPRFGTREARLRGSQTAWEKAGMADATGMSFQQAYRQSRDAFEALADPNLQQTYLRAVESMGDLRQREKNNLQRIIEAATEGNPELRAEQLERMETAFAGLKGAYWPLYREGEFILEYMDGDTRMVEHFETDFARRQAMEAYTEFGVDPATFQLDKKDKTQTALAIVPEAYNKQLADAVEASFLKDVDMADPDAVAAAKERGAEAVRNMTEIWLRWQPETSALKNSIKRRNVKGHSMQMLRGFLRYSQTHGARVAQMEEGRKIEQLLADIASEIKLRRAQGIDTSRERDVLNDMRAREAASKTVKVNKFAQGLGKATTFWYMTSPSIALVQMTQLGVLTFPKLAVMFNPAKAASAMTKGVQAAFSPKYTRKAMFGDIEVNSVFDDTQAVVTPDTRTGDQRLGDPLFTQDELRSRIEGLTPYQQQLLALRVGMARNLLDISLSHEVGEIVRGGDPDQTQSKVFQGLMSFMRVSETASRKAAILGTFEAATANGQDFFSAIESVEEVVESTLYNYSKDAKGVLLQGSTARVLLTFQTFRIMTAYKLGLLFKQSFSGQSPEVKSAARKELVGIFGMSAALSGVMGMPFSAVMFKILDAVLGDEDEPYNSEAEFRQWLEENFGETGAAVAAEGPASLLGAALSRRIGLGDVFGSSSEMPAHLHGDGAAAWWATQLLGPSYSMVAGWAKGYDQMVNEGEVLKGLELASPKPLKDMLKAYSLATDGLKTGMGKRLMTADQIGADEVLMMALGFQPLEVSRIRDKQFDISRLGTMVSRRRGQLVQDFVKAFNEDGDTEDQREAIRKFNSKMPEFGIGPSDLRSGLRSYAKGERGIETRREMLLRRRAEQ